jgi:hypothetical protein
MFDSVCVVNLNILPDNMQTKCTVKNYEINSPACHNYTSRALVQGTVSPEIVHHDTVLCFMFPSVL